MTEETKNIIPEAAPSELTDSEAKSVSGGDKISGPSKDTVLIYERASMRAPVIGGIGFGEMIEYGGETLYDENGRPAWRSVVYNGQYGWVRAAVTHHWVD